MPPIPENSEPIVRRVFRDLFHGRLLSLPGAFTSRHSHRHARRVRLLGSVTSRWYPIVVCSQSSGAA